MTRLAGALQAGVCNESFPRAGTPSCAMGPMPIGQGRPGFARRLAAIAAGGHHRAAPSSSAGRSLRRTVAGLSSGSHSGSRRQRGWEDGCGKFVTRPARWCRILHDRLVASLNHYPAAGSSSAGRRRCRVAGCWRCNGGAISGQRFAKSEMPWTTAAKAIVLASSHSFAP